MTNLPDIGQLKERVQILAPTTSVGGNGERIETWGEYGTRWMLVEPMGGGESSIDDMAMSVVRAKFTARYDGDITEKFRLVWNGQTWNIRAIEFDPGKVYIMLTCDTNTLTGGTAADYGDYYATNSLKIRTVTGTYDLVVTDALITTAVGLTATQAGAGYTCFGTFTKTLNTTLYYLIVSNGTSWFTSDMRLRG